MFFFSTVPGSQREPTQGRGERGSCTQKDNYCEATVQTTKTPCCPAPVAIKKKKRVGGLKLKEKNKYLQFRPSKSGVFNHF